MAKKIDNPLLPRKPFVWNTFKDKAALLLAEDELTDEVIAGQCGVSRQAMAAWKLHPDFQERITDHITAARKVVLNSGIGLVQNRVKAYQDRWNRMKRVIIERAADPKMASIAGGSTGLLVHDIKSVGSGANSREVDVYEVDTGLLKEMRELEKQAAQDLGQWTEKADVTSGGKTMVVKVLRGVSMDDL